MSWAMGKGRTTLSLPVGLLTDPRSSLDDFPSNCFKLNYPNLCVSWGGVSQGSEEGSSAGD